MIIKRHKELYHGCVDGRNYQVEEGMKLSPAVQKFIQKDDIFKCAKRGESIIWELDDGRKMTLSPEEVLNEDYVVMVTGPKKSKMKGCPPYQLPCFAFIED